MPKAIYSMPRRARDNLDVALEARKKYERNAEKVTRERESERLRCAGKLDYLTKHKDYNQIKAEYDLTGIDTFTMWKCAEEVLQLTEPKSAYKPEGRNGTHYCRAGPDQIADWMKVRD